MKTLRRSTLRLCSGRCRPAWHRVAGVAGLSLVVGLLASAGLPNLGAQEPPVAPPPTSAPEAADALPASGGRFVRGRADAADAPPAARSLRQVHTEIDEATRTLFVTTDTATNEQVMQVINALDQPVAQALIKVLFLEVTHDNDLDLGLEFKNSKTTADGDRSAVSSMFDIAKETDGGIVNVLEGDLEVTLRALAKVSQLNVLSRPSILARNNEEATITIGQEVPFIRNTRITEDGQTLNTVEYEDIGIILTVTPHIGTSGLIEMDVAPEISTTTADTVPISDTVNAPVFAKRAAETHVVVPSGRTVIIGGLMEDQATSEVSKVPLLGSIPWLGALFRRTVTSKSKTELLIFLTPTLVDSGAALAAVSEAEKGRHELIREQTTPETLRRYLEDGRAPPPATP
jgi:general secretion pathway protein D